MGEAIKYLIRWDRDTFSGLIGCIMGILTLSNQEWEGMEIDDHTCQIVVLVLGIEWENIDLIRHGMFPCNKVMGISWRYTLWRHQP